MDGFPHLSPDLALWLTLSGSNYTCLEQISMNLKMFEPLKFNCIKIYYYRDTQERTQPRTQSLRHQIKVEYQEPTSPRNPASHNVVII